MQEIIDTMIPKPEIKLVDDVTFEERECIIDFVLDNGNTLPEKEIQGIKYLMRIGNYFYRVCRIGDFDLIAMITHVPNDVEKECMSVDVLAVQAGRCIGTTTSNKDGNYVLTPIKMTGDNWLNAVVLFRSSSEKIASWKTLRIFLIEMCNLFYDMEVGRRAALN